jgi:hypothetical protein
MVSDVPDVPIATVTRRQTVFLQRRTSSSLPARRDLDFHNGPLSTSPAHHIALHAKIGEATSAFQGHYRLAGCEVVHMTKPRRKKHFIDACVQGSLARRILVHWLTFLAVASLVAFVLQVLSDPFRPLATHLRGVWWTHGPFLLVLTFLLPVFIIDTIKLSNRFAGPVYSLRRAIREIAQGKTPRKLKFRRHDFWHDLADDYNAMLLRLDLLENNDPVVTADEELIASNK